MTTPIKYFGDELEHASGFYFKWGDDLFLITNKHVVDITTANDEPLKSVKIYLRPDKSDVRKTEAHTVRLVIDESPTWIEHPSERSADIVAIPIRKPVVGQEIEIDDIANQPLDHQNLLQKDDSSREIILTGSTCSILGYPYRRPQQPYFPVFRNALIASPYGQPFNNQPRFMTDARTHSGLSGSPVITPPTRSLMRTSILEPHTARRLRPETRLIGIHSGVIGETETLDLNETWYPNLLEDIFKSL